MAHLEYSAEKFNSETSENNLSALCGVTICEVGGNVEYEELLVLEPHTKTKRPPLYKVVMLNDDYTPMDFVVEMLKGIFRHMHEDAMSIMMQIHNDGAATCGIFTRDVAETKMDMVISCAKRNEYPLQCVMEHE